VDETALRNLKRSLPVRQPKDFIVFPLDVPSAREAEHYIGLLSGRIGMFKVGLELFICAGPEIIRTIHRLGKARIFLDLKLHDIPETVSRAVERIAGLGVDLTTIHCGESARMLEAAVSAAAGRVGILGVTVLTSVSAQDIRASGFDDEIRSDPGRLVLKRAAAAHAAGCSGVVCSGLEVPAIKKEFGKDFIAVTPGIRPESPGKAADDQRRITTPARAVRSGADYLVIGRPIRDAKDPLAAVEKIAEEIESALSAVSRS
jgi:orotidine-5'-phosphate decarboxylase